VVNHPRNRGIISRLCDLTGPEAVTTFKNQTIKWSCLMALQLLHLSPVKLRQNVSSTKSDRAVRIRRDGPSRSASTTTSSSSSPSKNFLLPKEKIQKKNQEKRAEIICYYFYYQCCRLFCQKETLLILYLKYYAIKKKIYYHTIAFFSPPNLISIFINCSTSYYAVSIRYLPT